MFHEIRRLAARHSTLLVGIVACSGCELVLGEVPEQPALSAAGGNAGEHDASVAGAGGGGGRAAGNGGGLSGGATASATGGVAGGASTTGVAGASTGGGMGGASGAGAGGSTGGGAGGSMGRDGGREGGGGSGGATASGGSGGTGGGSGGNGGSSGSGGNGGNGGTGPSDASGPRDAEQETPVVDPCDADGDAFRSNSQQCGGTDCDDNNSLVFPGDTLFYDVPTHPGGINFDYDCNGVPEPRYSFVNCSSLLGVLCDPATTSGFLGTIAPACGERGSFGHCEMQLLDCVSQEDVPMMPMPCR